jgi:hypothetical protein
MATNKELRLEQAQESLAMAQKMIARFQGGVVPASEVPRIQDAATQATQAAAQLNQLVGLLLADLEA